jgi:ABC-2 type transport system ATP-binding protein
VRTGATDPGAPPTILAVIAVDRLEKHFLVHRRPPGFGAALRSIVHRRYETVRAVDGVTFRIRAGERVGFLGPNGAGKTTTLKVLSGLLHPTSGRVRVNGEEPRQRSRAFLSSISLVMGQKQQLMWDLPPAETFELNRAIYGVPLAEYRESLRELDELLGIAALAGKPTRQLSLGERMRCELAAALLHRPTTLFLDEPTIGLDIDAQAAIREFIRHYNERFEATVLLTSHYMDDVTSLCPRVIIIDRGRLLYDGDLRELVKTTHPDKLVAFSLTAAVGADQLERLGTVAVHDAARVVLRVSQDRLQEVVSYSLANLPVADLTVEDPPLEDVLHQLFRRGPEPPFALAEAPGQP